MFIDSHCHMDFPAFDVDREQVLEAARAKGVGWIIVPGVSRQAWTRQLEVCQCFDGLLPALGLHPMFIDQHVVEDLDALRQAVIAQQPSAIGEIGLDFYLPELDRRKQVEIFDAQLALAGEMGLPVILHVRKAHEQVIALLRRHKLKGGFVHAYSGSHEQARQYLELGFKLGFGGAVTYERARKLRSLAQQLPDEAIVLETDAPDMSPAAHHGQRNSPAYLPEIATVLSQLRGRTVEDIAAMSCANVAAVVARPSAGWEAMKPVMSTD